MDRARVLRAIEPLERAPARRRRRGAARRPALRARRPARRARRRRAACCPAAASGRRAACGSSSPVMSACCAAAATSNDLQRQVAAARAVVVASDAGGGDGRLCRFDRRRIPRCLQTLPWPARAPVLASPEPGPGWKPPRHRPTGQTRRKPPPAISPCIPWSVRDNQTQFDTTRRSHHINDPPGNPEAMALRIAGAGLPAMAAPRQGGFGNKPSAHRRPHGTSGCDAAFDLSVAHHDHAVHDRVPRSRSIPWLAVHRSIDRRCVRHRTPSDRHPRRPGCVPCFIDGTRRSRRCAGISVILRTASIRVNVLPSRTYGPGCGKRCRRFAGASASGRRRSQSSSSGWPPRFEPPPRYSKT